MRAFFLFVCMCFVRTYSATGQANNCENVGFEEGNISGWKISYGTIANDGTLVTYTNEVNGTVENEHIITNKSNGNDRYIYQENIPMVAPGSDYSVRIGNITRGSKFDRLQKTFTITADNTLFQYKFAIILQDDANGHATYQKPGFNVKLTDESGREVGCSYYDIQLQPQTVADGFKTQNDLQYRNWTTVAMDLRNYVGQRLTVEVTVHGCTRMRHFGYAYFDASCAKSEVDLVSSCPDANGYLTFKAPEGFETYLWSNGATASTAKIKANIGDKVSVKMIPYNSLNANCDINLDYTVDTKIARSSVPKTICDGESYTFLGKKYTTSGVYSETLKQVDSGCDSIVTLNLRVLPLLTESRKITLCVGEKYNSNRAEYKTTGVFTERVTGNVSCDSLITIDVKVNPLASYAYSETICEGKSIKVGSQVYNATGNYTTTIKRTNQCDSIVSTALIVQPRFQITIPNDKALIEKGENVSLNMTVNPSGTYQYLWNHKESLSCVSCINPISTPSVTTTYNVVVTPANGLCPQSQSAQIIVSCGVWLPNAFTPNSDGMNDVFYIYSTKCIQQINEIQIYDRWGELIFRDQNFQASDPSHGWDGMYRGKLVLPDTYNYKITATYRDGEIGNFAGAINVMY
jgi:gliding motility-associated-like protein